MPPNPHIACHRLRIRPRASPRKGRVINFVSSGGDSRGLHVDSVVQRDSTQPRGVASANSPELPFRAGSILDEQTVVVPGTEAAALIVPSLARSLVSVLDQRKLLAARVEELLDAHPLAQVLTSMPGIGVRTAARILIDVGDGSSFATAGHLAAYAGLAPATRRSGPSIRSEQPSRRVTDNSREPSTSPPSPRCHSQTHVPTTTENGGKANTTSPRSSASPDAASTSSSPCSATAPSTSHRHPLPLDEDHRGTFSPLPRRAGEPGRRWSRR